MSGQVAQVSVIVPFTPGACEHRDRAWAWVRARLEQFHPGWQIVVGTCEGEWSKGRAVADALSRADGDILVIHDADSFVPAAALTESVEATRPGLWSMPHREVHRLSDSVTRHLYDSEPCDVPALDPRRGTYSRHPYPGTIGGGVLAITRSDYLTCPIDARFTGWGGEDDSWGRALCTLIAGKISNPRINPHGFIPAHTAGAPLWHLDHPLAPTHRRRAGVRADTEALVGRYKEATGVPRIMASLIAGEDPVPPDPLTGPVTFRLRRPVVRIPAGKIRPSADRLHTTDDPVVVEQLRACPHAEEVTP